MWGETDKEGYLSHKQQEIGQISNNDFSIDIETFAKNKEYKTFLEIGTWNGLGSTKAFVNGFNEREDIVFYSLECNREKHADAKELYRSHPNVHILNEVVWKVLPDDFYETFPVCLEDTVFKSWNEIDMVNMKDCPVFLDRLDIPSMFDVILLDGGEFTTYYDFKYLKERCRILMLDDIHTYKCEKIVNEIKSSTDWEILKESHIRNGYMICKRIQTSSD
jgi:hypothetical protein